MIKYWYSIHMKVQYTLNSCLTAFNLHGALDESSLVGGFCNTSRKLKRVCVFWWSFQIRIFRLIPLCSSSVGRPSKLYWLSQQHSLHVCGACLKYCSCSHRLNFFWLLEQFPTSSQSCKTFFNAMGVYDFFIFFLKETKMLQKMLQSNHCNKWLIATIQRIVSTSTLSKIRSISSSSSLHFITISCPFPASLWDAYLA